MTEPLRILFAGTPDFAVPPLEALISSQHEVITVLTQPDRPAGRGRHLKPSPVKDVAVAHHLQLLQPVTLKNESVQRQIAALQPDLMVVVAYGLILPQAVLDIPRLGCLNIHASLLPRWRGAAPIQRAILAGDKYTGVAIMQMEAGLDTGPIWHEERIAIAADETGGQLHDRLSRLGAIALMHVIGLVEDGESKPRAQGLSGVLYAEKLNKEEGMIDWKQSAENIYRKIRAFNPWPVAYTSLHGKQMRIWQASYSSENCVLPPGTVLSAEKKGITVQCGEGNICIEKLQMPGKRTMNAAEFLNAHDLQGQRFE